nr:hypothetical protein [Actinomadura sp. CNU-125]
MRTWFSPLPIENRASARALAYSIASAFAIPRVPGESGAARSAALPTSVLVLGLGTTSAPFNRISVPR